MEAVVTEELRGRGSEGRELVEGEEAVELVHDFKQAVEIVGPPPSSPLPRQGKVVWRETTPSKLLIEHEEDTEAVRRSLASLPIVNTRPKPPPGTDLGMSRGVGISIEELERESRERREAKRVSGVRFVQPEAKEFLARPYHQLGYNRFLFSFTDEPDGCNLNRGSAWEYTPPNTPGSSADHAAR